MLVSGTGPCRLWRSARCRFSLLNVQVELLSVRDSLGLYAIVCTLRLFASPRTLRLAVDSQSRMLLRRLKSEWERTVPNLTGRIP